MRHDGVLNDPESKCDLELQIKGKELTVLLLRSHVTKVF